MKPYLIFELASGKVVQTGLAPDGDPIDEYAPSPDHRAKWLADEELMLEFYIAPRPAFALDTVPVGTAYAVSNLATGEVLTGTIDDGVFDLDVAGTWRVELTPPWPWKVYRDEIVVDA